MQTSLNLHTRKPVNRIVSLGSYVPRQCGIATFTSDLSSTLCEIDPHITVDSIAINDHAIYQYPKRVRYVIPQFDEAAYALAADYINNSAYDLLSVQHEYGIYGGESGCYLMRLVRKAKMPIVTTLHTVLQDTSQAQRQVLDELLQLSERVVVMSQKAVQLLVDGHNVSPYKIDLIHHGIPSICGNAGSKFRKLLKVEGPLILTFGLLSPDKGIQYVIKAMPTIVKRFPGATYIVVGATHPNVVKSSGESYRDSLIDLSESLGVSDNVRFVNRFVSSSELAVYLGAMDIYVTPYLNQQQITSGTLAYSIGSGKAVISTPYWYAEELLAEGRGILVPFRSEDAISSAVTAIQSDPVCRNEMCMRAAEYGKRMLWPEVGKQYLNSFRRAKLDSSERLRSLVTDQVTQSKDNLSLPDIHLKHLFDLSDDTGILQHATFTVPNRSEGYCVDDNARALLLTCYLENSSYHSPEVSKLQGTYQSFIVASYNQETGRFRNFLSYERKWLEQSGSEDSHGRSLWALGSVVSRCKDKGRRDAATSLFEQGLPALGAMTSPRAWAYSILGLCEFMNTFPRCSLAQTAMDTFATRLLRQYDASKSLDWPWFEQSLTYANGRLSQALIVAGSVLNNSRMLETGLHSLKWLLDIQTSEQGYFAPVGTNGFYHRGGAKADFDQQPIEAWSAVSACLSASKYTSEPTWRQEAHKAFSWFSGENILGRRVYDQESGGCHDGLHPNRVNRNQGAESTLSFLCSLCELQELQRPGQPRSSKAKKHEVH